MNARQTHAALRWFGGKWLLAPHIVELLPPHEAYVEPFGGAGSVLFHKAPVEIEVWNDIDDRAVNFFQVLRGPESARLIELVELTPYARTEYFSAREPAPADDPIEAARRLAVLAGMSFGGGGAARNWGTGFRFERIQAKGSTFSPARIWAKYPDALRRAVERLRGVVIEHGCGVRLIERLDAPGVVFYVDPPYLKRTRLASHKCQYRHEFGALEHERLLQVLARAQGAVLLSGYDDPLYRERLPGWRSVSLTASDASGKSRRETVWLSPQVEELTRQGDLFRGV